MLLYRWHRLSRWLMQPPKRCGGLSMHRPGPFPRYQEMSPLHLRRQPCPPWHLANVAVVSLVVMAPHLRPTAMKCRPQNESGVARQLGFWQRGPRQGPTASQRPGSQKQIPTRNPRKWDAQTDSRPRTRREFTVGLCWDRESRRGERKRMRTDG